MKILIVKSSSLGDILQCFAVIDWIQLYFPFAIIDWVVEKDYVELLQAHPKVHRVLSISTKNYRQKPLQKKTWKDCRGAIRQLRKERYDHVFDLQGNVKSALLTAFSRGRKKAGFSFRSAPEWVAPLVLSHRYFVPMIGERKNHYLHIVKTHFRLLRILPKKSADKTSLEIEQRERAIGQVKLTLSPEEEKQLFDWKEKSPASLRFLICFGSRWENKKLSLPTWQSFLSGVAKKLSPLFFFSWGNEEEKEEAENILQTLKGNHILLPKWRLSLWQRFMEEMDAIIAIDSSALHLATTTKAPSFGIFGPSLASCYHPEGDIRGYFQAKCPYKESFFPRCPKLRSCPTGACLKQLDSQKVLSAFFYWWEGVSSPKKEEVP